VSNSNEPHTETYRVDVPEVGAVDLTVDERGEGRPVLLLHGGAGPISWARFAPILATRLPARVLTPTHPGFARTPRPEGLRTVPGLAALYAAWLRQQGLTGVTVIGNSVGGWIAAELAALQPPGVSGLVLVSAGGLDVPGQTIPDVSKLTLDQIMALSYHDPAPFRIDPAKLTEAQRAVAASNRTALQVYAPSNVDPTLASRLPNVRVPTVVVTGEADRMIPAPFGRAYAAAIPGATFVLLSNTGHLPQLETPELLWGALRASKLPGWPAP
jgi:pimeloyl-ACP methyl ester carboxylesterase